MLVVPLWGVAAIDCLWYKICFVRGWHFDGHLEGIITAALIPLLAVMYCLLATAIFRSGLILTPRSGESTSRKKLALNLI